MIRNASQQGMLVHQIFGLLPFGDANDLSYIVNRWGAPTYVARRANLYGCIEYVYLKWAFDDPNAAVGVSSPAFGFGFSFGLAAFQIEGCWIDRWSRTLFRSNDFAVFVIRAGKEFTIYEEKGIRGDVTTKGTKLLKREPEPVKFFEKMCDVLAKGNS